VFEKLSEWLSLLLFTANVSEPVPTVKVRLAEFTLSAANGLAVRIQVRILRNVL
jgi:hypothetical protein